MTLTKSGDGYSIQVTKEELQRIQFLSILDLTMWETKLKRLLPGESGENIQREIDVHWKFLEELREDKIK